MKLINLRAAGDIAQFMRPIVSRLLIPVLNDMKGGTNIGNHGW